MSSSANDIQDKLKSWIFPTLLGILSWLIMDKLNNIQSDITSMKADIKVLSADNISTKTDLKNLKEQVNRNTSKLFSSALPANTDISYHTKPEAAILPEDKISRRRTFIAPIN